MANRKDFFFRQKVTEAELDEAFDGLEDADRALVTDANSEGVWFGLTVAENGLGQDESVDVALGAGYDQDGQRMFVPSLQNVDVSVDNVSASTQVAAGGNEKLVGVYLKFDRALSDPRVDGNSLTVFFARDESYTFVVRQGPEETAPATTAPALQADEILLADIRRVFNDNTIANADIETTRRQNSWVQTIGETAGVQASEVDFDNANAAWAGGAPGSALAATDVQAAIDETISDLASQTVGPGNAGAYRVGLNVTETWASGDGIASGNLGAAFEELLGDLKVVSPTSGAARIGFQANQSQWTNAANAIAAGTIQAAIDEVITDLASQGATPGAALVGANEYSGTALALVDGSIESQLQAIADNVASASAAMAWTNLHTYDYTASDINPVIDFLHEPVAGNRKLIFRALLNAVDGIYWRIYASDASNFSSEGEAFEVTINAEWDGAQWVADDTTASFAVLMAIDALGHFYIRTETTPTVAWSDGTWDNIMRANNLTGDFTSTQQATGQGGIAAQSGAIGVSNDAIGGYSPYSHVFPATPSSITSVSIISGFNSGGVTQQISATRTVRGVTIENNMTTGVSGHASWTFLAS